MWMFYSLEWRALATVVATTVAFSSATHGGGDVCTGADCGDRGAMLLLINTSLRSVALPHPDTEEEEEDGGVPAVALNEGASRTYKTEAERLHVLANLEYDSDGDDENEVHGYEGTVAEEADLEFFDGDDHKSDSFQTYVKSQGYSEAGDATWAPAVWNSAPEVQRSHNCYMYALNDLSPISAQRCASTNKLVEQGKLSVEKKGKIKVCKKFFHKPGYFFQNVVTGRARTDTWNRAETTCHLMNPMLAADSPALIWRNEKNVSLTEADSCPESHYMAALFIHPKAGFHFYRRDHACEDSPKELCWSHKPGIMKATDKDASGHKIKSIMAANRNYGELNYSELCSLFCVPQNARARTHSDFRRKNEP